MAERASGAFSSELLAQACTRVVSTSLPALTSKLAERLIRATEHWTMRAQELEASLQQQTAEQDAQEAEQKELLRTATQLEQALSRFSGPSATRQESARLGVFLRPVGSEQQQHLIGRCLSAMQAAATTTSEAKAPAAKRARNSTT